MVSVNRSFLAVYTYAQITSFFEEISPDTYVVMEAVVCDPAYVGSVRSVRKLPFFAVERWAARVVAVFEEESSLLEIL